VTVAVDIPDGLVVGLIVTTIPMVVAFFAWLVMQIQAIRSNTDVTAEVLRNHERRISTLEVWQENAMVPAWRVTTQTTTVEKDPDVS
jgi:hypothetical protein